MPSITFIYLHAVCSAAPPAPASLAHHCTISLMVLSPVAAVDDAMMMMPLTVPVPVPDSWPMVLAGDHVDWFRFDSHFIYACDLATSTILFHFISSEFFPSPARFIMIIMFYSTIDAQIGSCLDHLQLYTRGGRQQQQQKQRVGSLSGGTRYASGV